MAGMRRSERLKRKRGDLDNDAGALFHKIFSVPHLLPFLSKTEILRIRQVDRDCREAVDLCLEGVTARNSLILPPLLSSENRQHQAISDATALHPDLDNKPAQLHQLVEKQKRKKNAPVPVPIPTINPFISRRASFSYSSSRFRGRTYWREVLTLLDKYGRELRSVSITYQSRKLTLVEMLETVHECLRRMPLLTQFTCCILSQSSEDQNQTEDLGRYPQMPRLPNLTRLETSIVGVERVQGRIFSCYYGQLVALDASLIHNFLELYEPQFQSTFPNLKYLSVKVDKEGHDQYLLKLMSFTGPLQQVEIKCDLDTPLCLSVFLHIMGPFRETISAFKVEQRFRCTRHSRMDLPIVKTLGAFGLPEPESVDLPRLKAVVIEFPNCGLGSFDPLLKLRGSPLQQLEILVAGCLSQQVYKAYQQEGEDKLKLEVYGHEGNMYSLNIWRLMPQLQNLNLNLGAYHPSKLSGNYRWSREGYALLQARRGTGVAAAPAQ